MSVYAMTGDPYPLHPGANISQAGQLPPAVEHLTELPEGKRNFMWDVFGTGPGTSTQWAEQFAKLREQPYYSVLALPSEFSPRGKVFWNEYIKRENARLGDAQ